MDRLTRMKPLIGITCCSIAYGVYGMGKHAASDTYVRATDLIVGGVPVLLPANGDQADIAALLGRLDGIVLTGSRSNVCPDHYAGPAHPEGVPEDRLRDAVVLPLIRAAISRGTPLLAICRGMQELNVALGGSLIQRLQDVPGNLDHSTPSDQPDARIRQGRAHDVRITPGSWLHRVAGATVIGVNSLHNQGIDRLADGLAVDAVAPDGVIEAVHVLAARGFAVGVQWHPEYDFAANPVSASIFRAFADAVHGRHAEVATAAE
jgi:putative glutamine amidotransferase